MATLNCIHINKVQSIWSSIHTRLLNGGLTPISYSSDCARRVYADDKYIYKVILSGFDQTSHLRQQSLKGEYQLLNKCLGISGVPAIISYENDEDLTILKMRRIDGSSLNKISIGLFQFIYIVISVGILLLKLVFKGIAHNDVKFDNIILGKDGKVYLIDFDQAIATTSIDAFIKTFLIPSGKGDVVHSYLHLIKKSVKQSLSPGLIRKLKVLSGKEVLDNELPILPNNASVALHQMLEAWHIAQNSDASSPGAVVAYYSFEHEGVRFPGERSWSDRWSVLQKITDYRNKRILELGCNMALLSTHLLKVSKAEDALCIDLDKRILQAATLVSSALGVKPNFRQQNLDSPDNWEDEFANFKPDIVFALNVLNWVEDKDRLMKFLGRFNEVIFEGHDHVDIEKKRFKEEGFTKINLITVTERNRPVLHCCKF